MKLSWAITDGDLMTTSEAARLLNRAPDTIRQMERSGRLPAMKTANGQRLFRRADVLRLQTAMKSPAA